MERFEVVTVGKVGKGLTVKREKQADDTEVVVAHLKFAGMDIDRDAISRLCGRALGWSDAAFFDSYGAPVIRGSLSLPDLALTVTGLIRGNSQETSLSLMQADLFGIEAA